MYMYVTLYNILHLLFIIISAKFIAKWPSRSIFVQGGTNFEIYTDSICLHDIKILLVKKNIILQRA